MTFNNQRQQTTTQRGYGADHNRAVKQARAQMVDGDPCCLCGQPMYHAQSLHLDHTPDRTAYRGLAHAHCNLSDAARRANEKRKTPPRPQTW